MVYVAFLSSWLMVFRDGASHFMCHWRFPCQGFTRDQLFSFTPEAELKTWSIFSQTCLGLTRADAGRRSCFVMILEISKQKTATLHPKPFPHNPHWPHWLPYISFPEVPKLVDRVWVRFPKPKADPRVEGRCLLLLRQSAAEPQSLNPHHPTPETLQNPKP